MVTADPAAHGHPLLALHLVHPHDAAALVILWRDRQRLKEPLEIEVPDGLIHSSHLVTRARQAMVLDRQPDTFDDDGSERDAAVVVHAADVPWYVLPLVSEHLDDLPNDCMAAPNCRILQAEVSLGDVPARCLDVRVAGAPREADDTIQGE